MATVAEMADHHEPRDQDEEAVVPQELTHGRPSSAKIALLRLEFVLVDLASCVPLAQNVEGSIRSGSIAVSGEPANREHDAHDHDAPEHQHHQHHPEPPGTP